MCVVEEAHRATQRLAHARCARTASCPMNSVDQQSSALPASASSRAISAAYTSSAAVLGAWRPLATRSGGPSTTPSASTTLHPPVVDRVSGGRVALAPVESVVSRDRPRGENLATEAFGHYKRGRRRRPLHRPLPPACVLIPRPRATGRRAFSLCGSQQHASPPRPPWRPEPTGHLQRVNTVDDTQKCLIREAPPACVSRGHDSALHLYIYIYPNQRRARRPRLPVSLTAGRPSQRGSDPKNSLLRWQCQRSPQARFHTLSPQSRRADLVTSH